jgi:hypothetical protein
MYPDALSGMKGLTENVGTIQRTDSLKVKIYHGKN